MILPAIYNSCLLITLRMLYFPHSKESCCLERLFGLQAHPPFPAGAVTALMLDGGVLAGKLSCPKMCQAARLPGQTPPAH